MFLLLLSDFQKTTTANFNPLLDDSLGIYELIPLTFTGINNVFVDSVYLENPFFLSRESNSLKVKMQNSGLADANDLLVKLFFNESQAATATVDIKAKSSEEITFDSGRISFEEYPVTFDNDFYFTVNRNTKIKIIEVKENEEITSVEKVYGNEELFDFRSYQIGNLDYSQINTSDLVVINGLRAIDLALSSAITELMSKNGNILLIPSDNPSVGTYQGIAPRAGIQYVDSAVMQQILPPDLKNPFFGSIFENENENFSMPEARPVIKWIRDRDALLRFRSGDPFLARYSGSGYYYLMASPLTTDYSGFDRHAIFVPVMYKPKP